MPTYQKLIGYLLLSTSSLVFADSFPYPHAKGDTLIGGTPENIQHTYAAYEDTLLDIARTYNLGQNEIVLANPTVDRWLPGKDTKIDIPSSRLLPDTPHNGLVLNLAEYRLYYYPKNRDTVTTHPISIGRVDWETPLGKTKVIAKKKNPVWRPPKSIKEEHAAKGEILPDIFPAGPDNPLGDYAIRLAVPGYLIHSTNKPFGVGMRVSHGCIRMYPEDIERLFPKIRVGTTVHIVNQDIKVGWLEGTLYIEVHPNLDDGKTRYRSRLNTALNLIEQANKGVMPKIKGSLLKHALVESLGKPIAIAKR